MIINNTEDFKKHISVSQDFEFNDIKSYINKAVIKFTDKYVGDLHITLAEEPTEENQHKAILSEARNRLQNALANFAMFLYIPFGTVTVDGSGISIPQSQNRQAADWWRVKDLQRDALTSGHEAMDQLLAYLEKNKDKFPSWANSDYYTQSKDLLVNSASVFNRWYTIFESRQTYLALQPFIRQVEDQHLDNFLCRELIHFLKFDECTGAQLQVKENLQKAIVAFTVAKVCNEGLFVIDAKGLYIKFDTLPSDKVQAIDYGKHADMVTQTVKAQERNGQNYLQKARDIIIANPEQFTQCASPIIQPKDGGGYQPIITKSVVGL